LAGGHAYDGINGMAAENSFGSALRGWRERLSPLRAGLEPGPGRRGRGLRRKELARLAGLSVDYVIQLEQGRSRNPSAQVVAALANALQLDPSERAHLFRCANLLPPSTGLVPTDIPARVHGFIQRLGNVPVAVFAADWTIVGWNPTWCAAMGDPGAVGPDKRNLIAALFRTPEEQARDGNAVWPVRSPQTREAMATALVADLRMAAARYPNDPRLAALIARLLTTSPHFARLWSTGSAAAYVGERKPMEHPVVGRIVLNCDALVVPDVDLKIVVFTTEPGTLDEEKLDMLRFSSSVETA
jgi:transcriptional regulator with XRE-family HTH domain